MYSIDVENFVERVSLKASMITGSTSELSASFNCLREIIPEIVNAFAETASDRRPTMLTHP
jgi:hypothetical protein